MTELDITTGGSLQGYGIASKKQVSQGKGGRARMNGENQVLKKTEKLRIDKLGFDDLKWGK